MPLLSDPIDPHAGVLLLPGLNLKSESLNEIANQFLERGFRSKIVDLTKPSDDTSLTGDELVQIWRNEARDAYGMLASSLPGRRILVFGYSLGALLALDLVLDSETGHEVFLLAPPIQLRFLPSLLLTVTQALPANYKISSRSLEHYRRAPWSLAVEYQALQRLRELVQSKLGDSSRGSLFGPVIISVRDEFISATPTVEILTTKESGLEATLLDLPTSSINHLILDRSSLGNEGWQLMVAEIERSAARVLASISRAREK